MKLKSLRRAGDEAGSRSECYLRTRGVRLQHLEHRKRRGIQKKDVEKEQLMKKEEIQKNVVIWNPGEESVSGKKA